MPNREVEEGEEFCQRCHTQHIMCECELKSEIDKARQSALEEAKKELKMLRDFSGFEVSQNQVLNYAIQTINNIK